MNVKERAPTGLPVWVTLREARFITGLSEGELRSLVRVGRIRTQRLRRPGVGTLEFLRASDLTGIDPSDSGVIRVDSTPAASPVGDSRPDAEEPDAEPSDPAGAEEPWTLFHSTSRPASRDPVPTTPATTPAASPRRTLVLGAVLGAFLLLAAAVAFIRSGDGADLPSGQGAAARGPQALAWGVRLPTGTEVAMVAIPEGKPPVAVALPGDTAVDLPGRSSATVSQSAATGGTLMATAQTTLRLGLDHYLLSEIDHVEGLVDRLGGIEVFVEAPFTHGGAQIGPGSADLPGSAVGAYLQGATPEDATARWEAVLAGILSARSNARAWRYPIGETEDTNAAVSIIRRAQGGHVLELPTAISEGARRVDRVRLEELLEKRLPGVGHPLVRVTVLNGNGRPGIGAVVNEILAPHGFRVIASTTAPRHDIPSTQVIASDPKLLGRAREAQVLLTVGEVFVGPQPTGVADLVIVVGNDFPVNPTGSGSTG